MTSVENFLETLQKKFYLQNITIRRNFNSIFELSPDVFWVLLVVSAPMGRNPEATAAPVQTQDMFANWLIMIILMMKECNMEFVFKVPIIDNPYLVGNYPRHVAVKFKFSMFQISNWDFYNEKSFRRPMQMNFDL